MLLQPVHRSGPGPGGLLDQWTGAGPKLNPVRNPNENTVHVLQAIVDGLEDELQWPDAEKRQQLAAVLPGMFHGCIGVADVKEYLVAKYLDPVKERRKSIVTNYYLLLITQAITFSPACVWEKMIVKSLLLVLCIYRKVNSSWMMNL